MAERRARTLRRARLHRTAGGAGTGLLGRLRGGLTAWMTTGLLVDLESTVGHRMVTYTAPRAMSL